MELRRVGRGHGLQDRGGIFGAKGAQELIAGVAEVEKAEPAVGGGEHHETERSFGGGVGDGDIFAAGAILPWRHAQTGIGALVDTAAGAEAGFVDGVGDRSRFAELDLESFDAGALDELTRSHADDRLEGAMQMEGAEMGTPAEVLERERLAGGAVATDVIAQLEDADGGGRGGGIVCGRLTHESMIERMMGRGLSGYCGVEFRLTLSIWLQV